MYHRSTFDNRASHSLFASLLWLVYCQCLDEIFLITIAKNDCSITAFVSDVLKAHNSTIIHSEGTNSINHRQITTKYDAIFMLIQRQKANIVHSNCRMVQGKNSIQWMIKWQNMQKKKIFTFRKKLKFQSISERTIKKYYIHLFLAEATQESYQIEHWTIRSALCYYRIKNQWNLRYHHECSNKQMEKFKSYIALRFEMLNDLIIMMLISVISARYILFFSLYFWIQFGKSCIGIVANLEYSHLTSLYYYSIWVPFKLFQRFNNIFDGRFDFLFFLFRFLFYYHSIVHCLATLSVWIHWSIWM